MQFELKVGRPELTNCHIDSANRGVRAMAKCECGCGQDAKGDFLPGHDQKLRVALEKRVGGLLAIRSLVEASDDYVLGNAELQ